MVCDSYLYRKPVITFDLFPGMVGPFLELTLIPEVELRKSTLMLFYDLIDCEFEARGNFKQVRPALCSLNLLYGPLDHIL